MVSLGQSSLRVGAEVVQDILDRVDYTILYRQCGQKMKP